MKDSKAYKRAKERIEARYGFYTHLIVYLLVNLLLFTINLVNFAGLYWFIYPLMGWGIGLFFHALSVFVFAGKGLMVTDQMIEKELKKRA